MSKDSGIKFMYNRRNATNLIQDIATSDESAQDLIYTYSRRKMKSIIYTI